MYMNPGFFTGRSILAPSVLVDFVPEGAADNAEALSYDITNGNAEVRFLCKLLHSVPNCREAMMYSVIISADDFGLTDGICRSIIDLFAHNAISSTSVMICAEGAAQQCRKLKRHGLSNKLGVHLQITSEKRHKHPLSPAKDIPSLVDQNGDFKSVDEFEEVNPDEVRLEWDRQIMATIDALETMPNHLDSHHHRHRIPGLVPVFLELAAKYGLPVRAGLKQGEVDGSSLGVKSTKALLNDWSGYDLDIDVLKSMIENEVSVLDGGVLDIITHPGFCDEELVKSSDWNTVRENDYNVLLALAREGWLTKKGIRLIGYENL